MRVYGQALSSNEELISNCSQRDAELRACKDQLAGLTQVHESLVAQLRSAEAESSSATQRALDAAQRLDAAQENVQLATSQLCQLQAELSDTRAQLAAAQADAVAQAAAVQASASPVSQTSDGEPSLPPPAQEAAGEINLLRSRVQQLAADLAAAHSTCEALKAVAASNSSGKHPLSPLASAAGSSGYAAASSALLGEPQASIEEPQLLKASSVTSVRARAAAALGATPGASLHMRLANRGCFACDTTRGPW